MAHERVKQVIDGPHGNIDRIVRSVRENGGTVDNKWLKESPVLADERSAAEAVAAITAAFAQPGAL